MLKFDAELSGEQETCEQKGEENGVITRKGGEQRVLWEATEGGEGDENEWEEENLPEKECEEVE